MKVLLVDDDRDIRSLLGLLLRNQGHEVVEYSDGESACAACRDDYFPLIIMDWELNGMDGVTACRKIRKLPGGEYSVVLMFTARSSFDDLQLILHAGADDYVQKPVEIKWLKIRLRIAITNALNKTARRLAEQQLEAARAKEIETGSRIQQSLLLGQPPERLRGAEAAAYTLPSQSVDGDFYDFYQHSESCFDVVIGDVMGKGVAAALIGAALKSRILHAISELKSESRGEPPPLERIFERVQETVAQQLLSLGAFVTLCYTRFYPAENRMAFINCGHPRVIRRGRGGRVEAIANTNLPLGVIHNDRFQPVETALEPGDLLFMYSDGITEARGSDGELFGEARLLDTLAQLDEHRPQAAIERVSEAVQDFTAHGSAKDDQTCVAIHLTGVTAAAPFASDAMETSSELTQLKLIRRFVEAFCQRAAGSHCPELSVTALVLTLNEAASNVMRHAYANQPGLPIRVAADQYADRIEFIIEHRGAPFTPPPIDPDRLNAPRESGMGLPIIQSVMDEVEYINGEDGLNAVRMVYYFPRRQGQD